MKNIHEYFLIFKSKHVLFYVTDKNAQYIYNVVWILWSTEPGKRIWMKVLHLKCNPRKQKWVIPGGGGVGRRERHSPGHCYGMESQCVRISWDAHTGRKPFWSCLPEKQETRAGVHCVYSPRAYTLPLRISSWFSESQRAPCGEEGRWMWHASCRWNAENKSIIVHYYNSSITMSCALIGNVLLRSAHQRLKRVLQWWKQIG